MHNHNTVKTELPATVEVERLELMQFEDRLHNVESLIHVLEMAAEGMRGEIGIDHVNSLRLILDQAGDQVGLVKFDICAMRGGINA